ncbi:MAG TPA: hypothetical protein VGM80_17225 [Gaiellaceae bacterium]
MRLRRLLFPIRLARARVGAGGERLALVAIGIVAGAAAIAAVLGGRLVMQDRSLAQATAQLAPADRSLTVAWFGAFGGNWRLLDRQVTNELVDLSGRQPSRAMLYREALIDGRYVNLRAADGLKGYVHLVSGRLPTTCTPSHCEVLRIANAGPIPSTPNIRLVEVGTATLDPDAPFAAFIQPAKTGIVSAAVQYHRPQPSPIVLADGVDGMSRAPELASFFRSYAWFVPLRSGDVHPWTVSAYTKKVDEARAKLESASASFQVTAPTDQLTAAVASSRVAARRLLLLGGETGALLLAFTILAASTLRRDAGESRRRLLWAGARRWQVELGTFTETAAVAVAGTVLGWVIGGVVAALVARAAGSPGGQVVEHSLLTAGGIAAAACTAGVSALLLYVTVRAPGLRVGRLAVTPLDVAALAAVAVVAAGYARGSVDTTSLAAGGGGIGAFVLLVPALVTFAAAIAAVRLLMPTLRGLGRLGRRGPVSLRLAALSLARNPGGATVAATFLVASLGLAIFAVTYRATLLRGQTDEAAYAAPAPYVIDENLSELVPVLHGWPGGPATPVIRLSGNVPSGADFSFLGVPAGALPATGGWRSDFASRPLGQLAKAVAPGFATGFHSTALPAGTEFELPASNKGTDVGIRAFFRSPLGDFDSVDLGATQGATVRALHGKIPFTGARLTSLQLYLLNSGRFASNGGTGYQPTARGTLSLGTPSVDGQPVPSAFAGWIGASGAQRRATSRVTLSYSLEADETTVFRAGQPTDGVALPVLATRAVAAAAGPDGTIALSIEGDIVTARIAGVIKRFPSIDGGAVIADRQTAEAVLDTATPGLGTTNELWAQSLPAATPDDLTITSRATLVAGLRADPLARGALTTLAATAALALALALVGLLLGIVGDRRDERGELFDLEAQGASPATIRTHLRLRALLVGAFGLIGGVATGAVLSALVLSLVAVTASSARPQPPLALIVDPRLLGAAFAGYALVAAVLVFGATRLSGGSLERAAEVAV